MSNLFPGCPNCGSKTFTEEEPGIFWHQCSDNVLVTWDAENPKAFVKTNPNRVETTCRKAPALSDDYPVVSD